MGRKCRKLIPVSCRRAIFCLRMRCRSRDDNDDDDDEDTVEDRDVVDEGRLLINLLVFVVLFSS